MVPAQASSPELPRVVVDEVARIGIATTDNLPCHARRRGVVLALHGRGPAPPWSPDRDSVDALVEALIAGGVPTRWTALGRARASEGALRRLAPCSADARTLAVRWPPAQRMLALSRAWLGRHLVLVVPAVLDEPATARDDPERRGPFASALAAVAAAAGAGSLADEVALGAELLAGLFAGFTLVVDARHALLRPRRNGRRPQRLAVQRALVCTRTGASVPDVRDLVARFDAFLCSRVTAPSATGDVVALVGACADDPWPASTAEPIGVDGPLWPVRPRPRDARPS